MGFLSDGPGAVFGEWGIAIPWIPHHTPALRQTHLTGNNTYSDLQDTLILRQIDGEELSEDVVQSEGH